MAGLRHALVNLRLDYGSVDYYSCCPDGWRWTRLMLTTSHVLTSIACAFNVTQYRGCSTDGFVLPISKLFHLVVMFDVVLLGFCFMLVVCLLYIYSIYMYIIIHVQRCVVLNIGFTFSHWQNAYLISNEMWICVQLALLKWASLLLWIRSWAPVFLFIPYIALFLPEHLLI